VTSEFVYILYIVVCSDFRIGNCE